jgi:single-strand DNA-binding protein
MSGLNKVMVMGYLAREPNIIILDNGTHVASFQLATITRWHDKKGDDIKQHIEWHKIVLYGKLAEISKNLLKAKEHVYVEGYLRTRKYVDKHGVGRYVTEIIAKEFNLVHGAEIESDMILHEEEHIVNH